MYVTNATVREIEMESYIKCISISTSTQTEYRVREKWNYAVNRRKRDKNHRWFRETRRTRSVWVFVLSFMYIVQCHVWLLENVRSSVVGYACMRWLSPLMRPNKNAEFIAQCGGESERTNERPIKLRCFWWTTRQTIFCHLDLQFAICATFKNLIFCCIRFW